jgi:hypothetical protein
MSYPKNKEEWWNLVDQNWKDLKNLIETFNSKNPPKLKITAKNAEEARQYIASQLSEVKDYQKLKDNRDEDLLNVFNTTYWNIPESTECWQYPAFGLLCDLCSEGYVLSEDN